MLSSSPVGDVSNLVLAGGVEALPATASTSLHCFRCGQYLSTGTIAVVAGQLPWTCTELDFVAAQSGNWQELQIQQL